MAYEALRHECRHDGCDEAFLTVNARNGHEQTHGENTAKEVRHAH